MTSKQAVPKNNNTTHRFDPGILREYDIRGLVGKTLTAADWQTADKPVRTPADLEGTPR